MKSTRQPWIYNGWSDGIFILLPAFLATLMVLLFPGFFRNSTGVPPWAWLVLIVGIDVAHVYSTLYRTYFDPGEFRRFRKPLIWIPILGFLLGVVVYWVDGHLFWRLLAYLAVYHFVRQQYGFFSLYARKEERPGWERLLDSATIYGATLYPLVYWHTHLPRNFYWFVPGDFVAIPMVWLSQVIGSVYLLLLAGYLVKETRKSVHQAHFNWPKNLILAGTVLSWYCGIVLVNGDLAFTATNVVAHGIPYMALIWFYGRKKQSHDLAPSRRSLTGLVFRLGGIPIFIGLILLFAYLEEGIWDGLVWREHAGLFPWSSNFPDLSQHWALVLLVPLLTLPQVTHYVIDGFIWRIRKPAGKSERPSVSEII